MTPETLKQMLDILERHVEIDGDCNWQAMLRDVAKPAIREAEDRVRRETIEECGEVAKRFITAGTGTPYVNGMNDSAVRIYQCILALKD